VVLLEQIKIARVVTVPEAFVHLKPFLNQLKLKNVQLTLISSAGDYQKVLKHELKSDVHVIEISREINIIKDIKSVIKLAQFFRKNKFQIIHSSTPKAGLLTALAGCFVPKSLRLHTFTGQRWATLKGVFREVLKFIDRLVIRLNNQCYADSPSQVLFLKQEGVARGDEVRCLHLGSYGGVDVERFSRNNFQGSRAEILKELSLIDDVILLLYVGRLTHDKGVDDLVESFLIANKANEKIKLLLIGDYEPRLDALKDQTLANIESNQNIFKLGFKNNPEKYFASCDIFCIASHREGFGTVVIEAAACGLPTIGTRIPGLVDSIVHESTGLLIELGNTQQFAQAIIDLSVDEIKRNQMALNSQERARKDFNANLISELQWQEYLKLLKLN
jgi:glycosyltransferase involved in cell wall biosynthesis